MNNERAKFEEFLNDTGLVHYGHNASETAWLAWQKRAEIAESERQASRVAALEEAVNSIKFLIIERGSCTNLCHRDCIEEIRSLAEAPTKEK